MSALPPQAVIHYGDLIVRLVPSERHSTYKARENDQNGARGYPSEVPTERPCRPRDRSC